MQNESDVDYDSMIQHGKDQEIRLHVRGISKHTSQEGLLERFRHYGHVSCILFSPKRFSFIRFFRKEDAQRAIEDARKGRIYLDRKTLSVSIAKPKINKKKENNEKKEKEKSVTEIKEITGEALINKLDDDSLIKIFQYFPMDKRLELEEVCVRWRDVGRRAWNDIRELKFKKSDTPRHTTRFIEKVLVRCGVYLKSLELDEVCSSHMLLAIRKHCYNLTEIKLAFTKYNVKHGDDFSKMEKLQSFTLTDIWSYVNNHDPLSEYYDDIFSSSSKNTVDISKSKLLMDYLLNLPKTIKSIHIKIPIPHDKFSIISPAIKASVFERFITLNSMAMSGYSIKQDIIEAIIKIETITKLSLQSCSIDERGLKLLTNLHNLEHLDLQKVVNLNDNLLKHFSEKFKKLKYLDVSACKNLSDSSIRELKNLNNLEVLLMNNMSYRVTDNSLSQLKGIKILKCARCTSVKDPGIIRLMENCPDLEELNVKGTSISKETLRLALVLTDSRKNMVILTLYTDLHGIRFKRRKSEQQLFPFIKIMKDEPLVV